MAPLKNEFSWSKTRDEVFKTCPRQYWFDYYGYWEGWFETALQRTRQIYVLKNLKNRFVWTDEVVHGWIRRSLDHVRRRIQGLPIDEVIEKTLDQMRAEFRFSKSKNYWKNLKGCALFEHEYEIEMKDDQWKKVAKKVEVCLRAFHASDIFDGLKSHPKEGWLEVEEFPSFHLDKVKIDLIIDCAIREEDDIYIYDWKMGNDLSEDRSLQMCCYALYVMEKWGVPPESVKLIEYDLSSDKSNWFSATHQEIEAAKRYIHGSIKEMASLLMNVEGNVPLEEDHFRKVEDERVSLMCHYQKVCRI